MFLSSKFFVILILACLSFKAFANEQGTVRSFPFTLRAAITTGTVIRPVNDAAEENIAIGGLQFAIGSYFDWSAQIGFAAWASILFDIPNSQLSRHGVEADVYYRLMGGPLKVIKKSEQATMILESLQELSFLSRIVFSNFGAATKDLGEELSGTAFDVRLGILYRYGVFGFEMTSTIFSVPAGTERLQSRFTEFGIAWRI